MQNPEASHVASLKNGKMTLKEMSIRVKKPYGFLRLLPLKRKTLKRMNPFLMKMEMNKPTRPLNLFLSLISPKQTEKN